MKIRKAALEDIDQIMEIYGTARQFMADNGGVTVTYDATGSGAGIEAASNGSADIGLSSRALKDEETASGLVGTTVALDGIAVIVNAGSKVADLTVEQMEDWAAAMGIEAVVIDHATTIRTLKNELRWNSVAFK